MSHVNSSSEKVSVRYLEHNQYNIQPLVSHKSYKFVFSLHKSDTDGDIQKTVIHFELVNDHTDNDF